MPTTLSLIFIALAINQQHYVASAELTSCQKAYFMLRECSDELAAVSESSGRNCCALLGAFDSRQCLETDSRLQIVAFSVARSFKPLRDACVSDDTSDSARAYSDGWHESMDEDFPLAAFSADTSSTKSITLEIALEGDDDSINAALAVAAASVRKITGRGALTKVLSITVIEEGGAPSAVCSCMDTADSSTAMDEEEEENSSFCASLRRSYLSLRRQLCVFTCSHRPLVVGLLSLQVVAMSAWIVFLLVNTRYGRRLSPSYAPPQHQYEHHRRHASSSPAFIAHNGKEFVVDASDPEWAFPVLTGGGKGKNTYSTTRK